MTLDLGRFCLYSRKCVSFSGGGREAVPSRGDGFFPLLTDHLGCLPAELLGGSSVLRCLVPVGVRFGSGFPSAH